MTKPIIIAFTGKKQSGKGSACKFLTANADLLWGTQENGYSVKVGTFPMAGPLKKLCIDVLGLSPEQVYGSNEQKDSLARYRWEDLPHYPYIRETVWQRALDDVRETLMGMEPSMDRQHTRRMVLARFHELLPKGLMTARQVMQHIGSMFRMMYKDIWAEACVRSITTSDVDVALIDDMRFPNEVELVKKTGGGIYRLTRDVFAGADRHESETALDREVYDWSNFDGVIENEILGVEQTNRLLLLALYEQGFIHNSLRLCECCDGIDPDALDYGASE